MSYLPKTLMITLSASLLVGLVINPTLCSLFMRMEGEPRPHLTREFKIGAWAVAGLVALVVSGGRPLTAGLLAATVVGLILLNRFVLDPAGNWVRERALPAALHFYEGRLRWALRHRVIIMGQAAVLFVGVITLFAMFNPGIEFFPEDIAPDDIWVQVETPVGTRAEVTDAIVQRIETELGGIDGRADYESVVATTGSKIADFGSQTGSQYATVAISFVDFELRERDTNETLEVMRSAIGGEVAGATITVDKPNMGPPTGRPINIEIIGEDFETLKDLGDRMVALLSNGAVAPKLEGLQSDLDDARPELRVEVDREKAALFGVTTLDIGSTVRSAINGTEASEFRDGEEEYDIVVRLAERYRSDLSSLSELTVESDMGDPVPLTAIATWRVEEGFSGINRKDMDRVVTVSSDVRAGYNANAVLAEVQTTLEDFRARLPTGYRLSYTGQQQEQQESQEFLVNAFLWALFLIAFILISQFDSILKPGLILSTVMLSTIGVLIGLLIFRMPFGVIMSGVGVISLAGIVVNNAIVLIDYIHVLRDRDGLGEFESLVMGGVTRFRPVMLTAVTTVMGLIPLAIGLNIDFNRFYRTLNPNIFWGGAQAAWWGPMAIAVIAGLTFATFLTLVLLPVMHSLLDDLVGFLRRHFRANGQAALRADDVAESAVG
jgi:multidrug efflux pump subunit AcrB